MLILKQNFFHNIHNIHKIHKEEFKMQLNKNPSLLSAFQVRNVRSIRKHISEKRLSLFFKIQKFRNLKCKPRPCQRFQIEALPEYEYKYKSECKYTNTKIQILNAAPSPLSAFRDRNVARIWNHSLLNCSNRACPPSSHTNKNSSVFERRRKKSKLETK